MTAKRIIAVDDEEDILELVRYHLVKEGFAVSGFGTGEAALAAVRAAPPDLLLLDLMLPGVDGFGIIRALRAEPRTAGVPIVIISARGGEADIVAGLELGAADYVTKPFSPRVLVARVRAALRRRAAGPADEQTVLTHGELTIDPGRHAVTAAGQPVALTATEFQLLHFLARRPGWVFTRNQIIDGVRGENYAVTDRAVDVHMVSLRRKLGAAGACLETIRGVGYRVKE